MSQDSPVRPSETNSSNPMSNWDRLKKTRWRIDVDQSRTNFAISRSNIIRLFDKLTNKRLRDLIVRLVPPLFSKVGADSSSPEQRRFGNDSGSFSLNESQAEAISRVLSANDYALILGMPGTGKTTTTALIVRALFLRGKSVLICAYTHNAVDNLCLKLMELNLDFLRLSSIFGSVCTTND